MVAEKEGIYASPCRGTHCDGVVEVILRRGDRIMSAMDDANEVDMCWR